MSAATKSTTSLKSFSTQYLTSALSLFTWLDHSLSEGRISVYAALGSLDDVCRDVEERFVGLKSVACESLGVNRNPDDVGDAWLRAVSDVASSNAVSSLQALASTLLKVSNTIKQMNALKSTYTSKWTTHDGECADGFIPSELLMKAACTNMLFEEGGSDEEMWKCFKELTEFEEGLLIKWRGVALKEEDKSRVKSTTDGKENTSATEQLKTELLKLSNSSKSKSKIMTDDEENVSTTEQLKFELSKLTALKAFRSKHHNLTPSLTGSKYDTLKFGIEGEIVEDFDDDIYPRNKAVKQSVVTVSDKSFPFRLNNYTLNAQMQPELLYNGTGQACDIPPLVSSLEEAQEVSRVCLVIPTQFEGDRRLAGGARHKLIKRERRAFTTSTNDRSVNIARAELTVNKPYYNSMNKNKMVEGQRREVCHVRDPENVSDIDIRKYANNWGPVFGFNL